MSQWLTPREASKELRVSHAAVYKWMNSGALKTSKIDGFWRIGREDLESFRRRRFGAPKPEIPVENPAQRNSDIARWQEDGGSEPPRNR